jgi:hypothetical protein
MSVLKAVYDVIKNDATVTNDLAAYDFGSGNEPAIFTTQPPPPDAPAPLVAIVQTGGSLIGRDRSTRGGEVEIDVFVWGNRGESEKLINDIAMNLWRALDRVELSVDGYDPVYCLADPPGRAPDDEGFPGYLLRARALVREITSTS